MRERSPARNGLAAGLRLLVLPLTVGSLLQAHPDAASVARILGVETVLVAGALVALSIVEARRSPAAGIAHILVPASLAGLVVTIGDVGAMWSAFGRPTGPVVLSVVAYDVVLGLALAVPTVVVLRAASRSRQGAAKDDIDASPRALVTAYRRVLEESVPAHRWHVRAQLAHQLIRRHIRRTLETIQRGYARKAVAGGPDRGDLRDRRTIDTFFLAVPPISQVVPIPGLASVFVLWKLVPVLVGTATTATAWVGGGHWRLSGLTGPVGDLLPDAVASFIGNAFALVIAFSLLMLLLMPAIYRRDRLLSEQEVCEREVILMKDRLGVGRPRSRRHEYVWAALPALPFLLYGGAVLVYALAGLFVYPSPEGPLGGLVQRADVMHLGPVTGAVLAQAFVLTAAVWIAMIVTARKATQVVLQ